MSVACVDGHTKSRLRDIVNRLLTGGQSGPTELPGVTLGKDDVVTQSHVSRVGWRTAQ